MEGSTECFARETTRSSGSVRKQNRHYEIDNGALVTSARIISILRYEHAPCRALSQSYLPPHYPPRAVPTHGRYIEIPQSHLTSNAGGLRSCNIAGNSVINSVDKRHRRSIRSLFLLYICKETIIAHPVRLPCNLSSFAER